MELDSKIGIVIIEYYKLFREGLLRILSDEKRFELLGEANNEIQAIHLVTKFKPHITLIGVNMLDLDGIQIIKTIKKISPETNSIIFDNFNDEQKIFNFLKLGAKGFIGKSSTSSELIKAIKAVCSGQLWVERKQIARFFNEKFNNDFVNDKQQERRSGILTSREEEVLHFLSKGFTNKEIANKLFISEKTVKSHLNQIFKKFNVGRRLEAVLYALKLGLA